MGDFKLIHAVFWTQPTKLDMLDINIMSPSQLVAYNSSNSMTHHNLIIETPFSDLLLPS